MSLNGGFLEANKGLLIFFSILGIFALLCTIRYLLAGFAIMKMAKRSGIKNSWLAFVPVLSTYILGKVAFEEKIMPILFLWLNVFLKFSTVLSIFIEGNLTFDSLSTTLSIFHLAARALSYYLIYKIYNKFSNRAVTMLVLDVLSCGLLQSIFLFAIRNNELRIKSK